MAPGKDKRDDDDGKVLIVSPLSEYPLVPPVSIRNITTSKEESARWDQGEIKMRSRWAGQRSVSVQKYSDEVGCVTKS